LDENAALEHFHFTYRREFIRPSVIGTDKPKMLPMQIGIETAEKDSGGFETAYDLQQTF
jgi:hypothetical protein